MSVKEQYETCEYDLFSMNFEEEERKAPAAPNVTFFTKSLNVKSTKNFRDLPNLVAERMKEKVEIFKTFEPGTLLLSEGYRSVLRFKMYEVQEDMILGRNIYKQKSGFEESKEPKRLEDMNDFEAVMLNNTLHFFTQNPYKPVEMISEEAFNQFADNLTNEEIKEMIVYAIYFNHKFGHSSNGKDISVNDVKKLGELYFEYNTTIGHFRKCIYIKRTFLWEGDNRKSIWNITLFNKELELDQEKVDVLYLEFILSLQAAVGEGMNSLTDIQLIAYYEFLGFKLRKDFVRSEWNIRKSESTKVMYVDRSELLDVEEMKRKWESFSSVKNAVLPAASRFGTIPESFINKYGKDLKLKPYIVPTGAKVELKDKHFKITNHRHYEVVSDDTKYVTLRPLDKYTNELVTDLQELLLPRKEIGMVLFKIPNDNDETNDSIKKYKEAVGKEEDNYRTVYAMLPYAIPEEMESTAAQIVKAKESYCEALSELEIKQYLTLEYILGKKNVLQAIEEKDFALASSILSNTGTGGGTSCYIDRFWVNYNGGKISYNANHTDSGTKVQMTGKQLLDVYLDMAAAIRTFATNQLTLPELILLYSSQYGISLRYFGIPGCFNLGHQIIHTSKYDITNPEETINRLFKKSSKK